MSWKFYGLGILCLATVTACAQPVNNSLAPKAALTVPVIDTTAKISAGACDDVGQFIPGERLSANELTFEASAAPTRR